MAIETTVNSLSLAEQVVLLGVTVVDREDETPVQTHELRRTCMNCVEDADTEVVGSLTEADVMRTLYRLEAEDIVEEIETSRTSPTGKGRPAYALAEQPETILEAVDDALVESVLE
ncbi:hypothetical protein [Natrarchaeobaculum sulfurireducens]|uniref:Uncharacterized protein n=1 Tax=Natrarchaeobaculum sulfurireducens TaxID=2044521 RepID=A0A346PIW2_9EURY|nr:hypothetical protein [Natrarchaeobaculum sulfurireducens]AXR79457.1 hypothetical protein AArc1_3151 [Natrarchaeobaculum sulfurireducens]AXR83226.1 hypothetical protein AArcMg_3241 [Natrarchaeobaculum sulfurireducens]